MKNYISESYKDHQLKGLQDSIFTLTKNLTFKKDKHKKESTILLDSPFKLEYFVYINMHMGFAQCMPEHINFDSVAIE